MAAILAADIGGTNCRLGLFSANGGLLSLERSVWIRTEAVADTGALLLAFERELSAAPEKAGIVAAAIAGPVEDAQRGKLSNGGLMLDFASLNAEGMRFFLLNDFMAQAYAILSPEGEAARHVAGPETPRRDGVRAVIGAGTGLGQAMVMRLATPGRGQAAQWLAVPSENGHAAFPFTGSGEERLHEALRRELGLPYATGDDVLTGRGLGVLHHFLTGERLTAAEVGARALGRDSETLRWYARLYGRACRHWILTTLCGGGLWIAGGIAARNPLAATCAAFREELYASPKWEAYLRSIPVYLMENTDSGLWGAARFGQQQLEAGQ